MRCELHDSRLQRLRYPMFLGLLVGLAACHSTLSQAPASLDEAKLGELDVAITNAIAEKRMPGAVLWVERLGQSYHQAYGHRALKPNVEPMTEDTIFDTASLTKVLATTPALMLLYERGRLKIDEPAATYLPEFAANGKDAVTIRQLMTHTSGLRPGLDKSGWRDGYRTGIERACGERLQTPPGTAFRYSDINFIVLGDVVRRISGIPLDQFVQREIYQPLQMRDTGYLPPESKRSRIAPTQGSLRGTVHDPSTRLMGGVAGHAGVFTTAADLARYARMLVNLGELDGVRILKPETVQLMTSVQSPESVKSRRGLGWDIDTGYSRRGSVFPIGSYGHTGFTGTSLWIDPFSKTFVIFLSNRVHPDGRGNVLALQTLLGTLAANAVEGFNFTNVPGALPPRTNDTAAPAGASVPPQTSPATVSVLNGIDVLVKQDFAPLKKLRVGLITNHSGHDRRRQATIDLLQQAPDVALRALFSPEHGIRGEADAKIGDSVDKKTGLPVYSLYGARRAPSPEQLQGLDALVFDIQDIGCRFYTYIATLGHCLEAAGRAKLKFFVLDRVNPINGVAVDGPLPQGESRFVAYHPLPLRHGMTVGELARMFNAERDFQADLTVIPLEGWKREMWFDETGLPWTNPSPNMRSLAAATVYPGLGLHEFSISVGRGTDTPFELLGAPYIDGAKLADELNRAGLPGIRFTPLQFTPTYSTFKNQACGGVSIVLTDRDRLPAVDFGIVLGLTLTRLYPKDYALDKVDTLLRRPETLKGMQQGKSLTELKQGWAAESAAFKQRRAAFLLYP